MKKLLFAVLAALVSFGVNAQEKKENCEQRCKQRIEQNAARLAAEFGFNDAQKANFTALYTEYCNALKAVSPKKDKCDRNGKCEKKPTLTDAQAKEMLQKKLECQKAKAEAAVKRADVNKKYADKFAKILTPQQTLKVMKVGDCKAHKGMRHKSGMKRHQQARHQNHQMCHTNRGHCQSQPAHHGQAKCDKPVRCGSEKRDCEEAGCSKDQK